MFSHFKNVTVCFNDDKVDPPTLVKLLDEVFDETVVKCLGECSTLDWVVVAAERTLFSDLSEAKEGWNNQKKFFARPGDAANSYDRTYCKSRPRVNAH